MPRIVSMFLDDEQFSAAVFLIEDGNRLTLETFKVEIAQPAEERPGLIERLTAFLKTLPSGEVIFGLSGRDVWMKWVNTLIVKESEWRRVAEFEASQAIPGNLADVIWASSVRAVRGELEIIFAAAKKAKIAELMEASALQTRRFHGIYPAGLALLNVYLWIHPQSRSTALVITLDAKFAYLVWSNGEDSYLRTVRLSRSSSNGPLDGQDVSIQLISEVARTHALTAFPRTLREFDKVFLAGCDSCVPGLRESLSSALKMPVDELSIAGKIGGFSPEHKRNENIIILLAGLAMKRQNSLIERLNLSKVARGPVKNWSTGLEQGAAVLLFLAALALPVVSTVKNSSAIAREVKSVESELTILRTQHTRSAGVRSELELAEKMERDWQAWTTQKTAWISFLADVQDIMWLTENVWLDQLRVVRARDAAHRSIKVELQGRWLDLSQPMKVDGPTGRQELEELFQELTSCEGVVAVENERFERASRGVMTFSCTLIMQEGSAL